MGVDQSIKTASVAQDAANRPETIQFFDENEQSRYAYGGLKSGDKVRDFVIAQTGMSLASLEGVLKGLAAAVKKGDLVLIVDNNCTIPGSDDRLPQYKGGNIVAERFPAQQAKQYSLCYVTGPIEFNKRTGEVVFPTGLYMQRDTSTDYWQESEGPLRVGWALASGFGQSIRLRVLRNDEAYEHLEKVSGKDDAYTTAVELLSLEAEGRVAKKRRSTVKEQRKQVLTDLERLIAEEEHIMESIESSADYADINKQLFGPLNDVRHRICDTLQRAEKLRMHKEVPGVSRKEREFVNDVAYQQAYDIGN
jgi:hypothetical protein